MADWITTDEALEIGEREYQQLYHVEYLRQLMRSGKVVGRKFGRSWQVDKQSWIDYLIAGASSKDNRRGGRPPEKTS
jgi:hypothetical protein